MKRTSLDPRECGIKMGEAQFIKRRLVQAPPIPCDFKPGDRVTFTNDAGVSFPNRQVIGFSPDIDYGRFIHLSGDTPYWFALSPDSLTLEQSS